ncbi:TetR/AcrR family transcriptional regulator [Ilyomonas limi]|uniref:TetR/AcrR family transcriptional regulator n=1 Tax=Ilyomonas limi TaxID=2575867 RepID=A0A4U3L939_9BACT|nr:TetR family transcriptional regulator C-terminal domain-containing protein [Ilyomonas limi]TKK71600.1 TetR/AcrR family transcriptional regulator [Ilyomonas limi]
MATAAQIQDAYIDYVLTHNEEPKSVYVFAKNIGITEQEFYNFYSSFIAVEKAIWVDLTIEAIDKIQQQEVWATYTSREKILAFFYAYIELLKSKRSFVVYSLKKSRTHVSTPEVLHGTRTVFEAFAENIIKSGLDSGELADRRFLSKRYKDALWIQFGIILNFWINDSSTNFEKTDEAIERGVNVTFNLFQRSPLDDIIDYGKFVARNSRFKERMRF